MSSGLLDGKVAIVTGGSRGTGAATARRFAEEGARVVIGDVLVEEGQDVAAAIGARARFVPLDITSEAAWSDAVAATVEAFDLPTVLVNNAAVLVVKPIEETSAEDFERVVRINQIGTFLGVKALIDPMRRAGGGSIVNVSSTDGLGGGNRRAAYCSSKWGVRGLTKAAALDLGRYGIRVNAVCPGSGSAEMIVPWLSESFDADTHFESVALGRPCDVDEVASAITYLASDSSSYISGADLAVDGGYTAGHFVKGFAGG